MAQTVPGIGWVAKRLPEKFGEGVRGRTLSLLFYGWETNAEFGVAWSLCWVSGGAGAEMLVACWTSVSQLNGITLEEVSVVWIGTRLGLEYLGTGTQSSFAFHCQTGEVLRDPRRGEICILVPERLVNLKVLPRVTNCLMEVPGICSGIPRFCIYVTVHIFCSWKWPLRHYHYIVWPSQLLFQRVYSSESSPALH